MLRGLRAAIVFLTRVPVGGFPFTAAEWRRAAGWFPLVGAGIGLLLAGVWLAATPLGTPVAAILTVALSVLVTGGLHEDGLADTFDALGGGADRERVLAILKDSRIGSFGALALIFSVLIRVALLGSLSAQAVGALILSQAIARMPPVWLMVALPYVTPRRVSRSGEVTAASWREVAFATVITLLVAAVVAIGFGRLVAVGVAMTSAAAVSALLGLVFWKRVGGITGDFLGATEQAGEMVVLLALAVMRAVTG